jgi:RNA polymerase sigma-70 factor (ECF subfamily)
VESVEQRDQIEVIVELLRDTAHREEGFRLLRDEFYGRLFRFFKGRGFFAEECKDLIQETLIGVHRSIEDFRGDARLDHWLFRIAHNTAVKTLRRDGAGKRAGRAVPWEEKEGEASPAAAVGASYHCTETSNPLRKLLDKERQELLSQAIDRLPPQMQRCMRLRVFQDLDYEDIAEVLEVSPSTVRVQLFEARKRLKIALVDSLAGFDW